MFGRKKSDNDFLVDPMWDSVDTENQTEFGSDPYRSDLSGQDPFDSDPFGSRPSGRKTSGRKSDKTSNRTSNRTSNNTSGYDLFGNDLPASGNAGMSGFGLDDFGSPAPYRNDKKKKSFRPLLAVVISLALIVVAVAVLYQLFMPIRFNNENIHIVRPGNQQQNQQETKNQIQETKQNQQTNKTQETQQTQQTNQTQQTQAETTVQQTQTQQTQVETAAQNQQTQQTQTQQTQETQAETAAQTLPVAAYGDGHIVWDPEMIPETGYWYERLSPSEKQTYLTAYRALKTPTAQPVTFYADSDWDAIGAMLDDHPEMFWLDMTEMMQYTDGYGHIEKYVYTPRSDYNQTNAYREQIEQSVQDYLSQIRYASTDYEKIKEAFHFVDEMTMYSTGAPENQNIISSFIFHKTVCAGYARSMGTLLMRAGVAWGYMTGTMEGGSHSWDIVRMDGEWTYVDAVEQADVPDCDPDYKRLGMNEDHIRKLDYVVGSDKTKNLPSCSNPACNYYWKEDLIMDSYSIARLEELKSRSSGDLNFRCLDENTYWQFYNPYMSGSIPELREYSMVYPDDNLLILRFVH